MSKPRYYRHSLKWGNPCEECPSPRVLMEIVTEGTSRTPPEILAAWRPGTGYSVFCQPLDIQPPRRWSQEAKARVRKSNLKKRLERRMPLFAAVLYAEELERRPDYYAARDHREEKE